MTIEVMTPAICICGQQIEFRVVATRAVRDREVSITAREAQRLLATATAPWIHTETRRQRCDTGQRAWPEGFPPPPTREQLARLRFVAARG